jgi:hypothetical protein
MTDTTKPNGDRDRPCDRKAAKNPRGPAVGPPEGTASSGSTSPPLDMALQRELAKEFGFYPATTNPEDIERHRRLNAAADAAIQPAAASLLGALGFGAETGLFVEVPSAVTTAARPLTSSARLRSASTATKTLRPCGP